MDGKVKIIVVHTDKKNVNRMNKILRNKTIQKRFGVFDLKAINGMLDIKHTRVPKLKATAHLCLTMTSAIEYLKHHPYFKNENNQSLVYMFEKGKWSLKFAKLNTLDKY